MSTIRFLLLEDNLLESEAIQAVLTGGGIDYELLRVDTCADFVTALETKAFDLILAAYALPNCEGISALEIARNLCPETPFIFISASLGEELAIETLKQGATDYVLKQRLERLVPAVNRALQEAQERRRSQRAEAARSRNEARLRAVATNLPHGAAFILDRDLRYLLAEGNALEGAGMTSFDLVGKTIWDALDPEIATRYEPYFRQALGGESFSWEHCSHERHYISHGTPLRDERGEVDAVLAVSYDITERKQSEAALRESEELKQSILESSQDCIKVLTLDSRISYISPGGLCLLEIDEPTSILNTVWADIWQGEDYEQAKAALAAAAIGNTGQFQGYLPTAKGTPKWWDSMITPVRDAAGQIVQLVAISRDITAARRNEADRQQAELALREAHVQLESALAAGGIYIWRWKIFENLVIVNTAFAHLFGVDPETAAIGLPIELFVQAMHEEDRSRVVAAINQAISTGEEYVSEYRVYTATGEERWLAARGRVDYASDGRPLAFPGAVADITERKRAEEDRDRFFQLSRDMLAIVNTEGYFLQANPAWTETLGYTTQELTAQPYIEFVHPDDRAATTDEAQKIAQGSPTLDFENRYRCRDGSYRWISWSVAPFVEQGLLYCVARDVTERKLAQAERERLLLREQSARSDAEQANRLKDEFLAVLSHELRSPLNPILGWARLLQNGKLDAARQAEALKTIERNARLQSQLIEDLLDISRIMQGKLTLNAAPVSLSFVISCAIETVRLAAEAKNIALALDLDNTIAPISGDAARLQQVVWNLLTNAVKFTSNGGQVIVELRQFNGLAQIRVIDTGKGINPQFLPYVFDYFRQEDGSTTRLFGGLGLGLAIVRQIVEMHGGTVKAESQGENQGAMFIVQLPLMPQAAPLVPEPTIAPADTAAPLENRQILLVDDEPDTREFQAFLLEQSGAKVTAVASGLEALQTLDHLIPDVLVSDVGMADMDGYMLIGLLRARPPNRGGAIPALALTAYAAEVDRLRAIEAGFQTFLTKPVEAETLVKAIITLLDGNQQ